MSDIVVMIPNFNGEYFLKNLELLPELDYIVMDNASTDNSVFICKKRGITVVENTVNVNRVQNWIRCIEYFKDSKYKWMKWLFSGDKLSDNAPTIINKAVNIFPNAALIVFAYDIVGNGLPQIRNPRIKESKTNIEQTAKYLVEGKNIFGSPIGIVISKEAANSVRTIETHDFKWAADVYIHYLLAKSGDVYYSQDIIGSFDAGARKHFQTLQNSIVSMLEELELIRVIAADRSELNLGDDYENTAVYHYLLMAISRNPKHRVMGKAIRWFLCRRADKMNTYVF